MVKVLNKTWHPFAVSAGIALAPNGETHVPDEEWAKIRQNDVVKAWLDGKALEVVEDTATAVSAVKKTSAEDAEKAKIREELGELGVSVHHSLGLPKLRLALEKARKEAAEAEAAKNAAAGDSGEGGGTTASGSAPSEPSPGGSPASNGA